MNFCLLRLRDKDIWNGYKTVQNTNEEEIIMKKWVCPVCGYVHEGDTPPEFCPQCHVPGSKFVEQKDDMSWAAEHVVGVG